MQAAQSASAVSCRGLRKIYDARARWFGGRSAAVVAVDGLDLTIRRGECFGLLGPNGAGKTTSVEILEGILAPTSGEVEVLGMRWSERKRDLEQRIGVSLQETRFADKLTVEETLRLFSSFYARGRDPVEVMD